VRWTTVGFVALLLAAWPVAASAQQGVMPRGWFGYGPQPVARPMMVFDEPPSIIEKKDVAPEGGEAKAEKAKDESNGNGKENGKGNGNGNGNGKDEEPEEEEDEIETDRPDFTESSKVVGKGRVQLETGYTMTYDKSLLSRLREQTFPEALLRIGVTECFEFRCVWTYILEEELDRLNNVVLSATAGAMSSSASSCSSRSNTVCSPNQR
jgi:hypothetical protein